MQAVESRGDVLIFKNANSSTFHPKLYLFRSATAAAVVVGSGNLTEGGLFTNYEAGLLLRLDLVVPAQATLLDSMLQALDEWSRPRPSLCYRLDTALLAKLVAQGHVPDEVRAWGDEKTAKENQKTGDPSLFARHSVPSAPKAPKVGGATASAEASEES